MKVNNDKQHNLLKQIPNLKSLLLNFVGTLF